MQRDDLEALYTRMERRLYNVVYRQLWSASDAQDVVQESFVRLWNMRDRVELTTVEPLVFRIALNLAKNRRRSRRLWQWMPLDPFAKSKSKHADDALAEKQTEHRMQRALDTLPPPLREVLLLCEMSELSYKDVAAALGIKEGTVGSRRNAALEKLRTELGEPA
ncbi:MAG: RNA polymerase sigma factor [Deltaproteobacteria bacterium]|nr:RNA polymerase sigma factor [Deltaproteobacteria bacterium]